MVAILTTVYVLFQVQTDQEEVKQRDLWVTDFVPMQNIYKLALALTSKEIGKVDVYVVHDHIAGYILINNLFKPSFFYNSAMSSQLFELSMKS